MTRQSKRICGLVMILVGVIVVMPILPGETAESLERGANHDAKRGLEYILEGVQRHANQGGAITPDTRLADVVDLEQLFTGWVGKSSFGLHVTSGESTVATALFKPTPGAFGRPRAVSLDMVSAKRKWTDILPEVPQAAWAPADPKEIADIRDMRTQVIESDNSWWILNVVIKLPVGCVLIIAGVFLFRRNREEVQGVGQASHAV